MKENINVHGINTNMLQRAINIYLESHNSLSGILFHFIATHNNSNVSVGIVRYFLLFHFIATHNNNNVSVGIQQRTYFKTCYM